MQYYFIYNCSERSKNIFLRFNQHRAEVNMAGVFTFQLGCMFIYR